MCKCMLNSGHDKLFLKNVEFISTLQMLIPKKNCIDIVPRYLKIVIVSS